MNASSRNKEYTLVLREEVPQDFSLDGLHGSQLKVVWRLWWVTLVLRKIFGWHLCGAGTFVVLWMLRYMAFCLRKPVGHP